MKGKGYLLFVILVTGIFVLSACAPSTAVQSTNIPSSQPTTVANQPTTVANQPAQNITLEYWVFSDYGAGAAGDLQRKFISEFEATHPGVTINMTPKSDDELNTGFVSAAASGTFPDIFMNGDGSGALLQSLGALANIKDRWMALPDAYRNQLNTSMMSALTSADGNTIYGIPYTGAATFLFRNLTVLKRAGIDPNHQITDWNDWLAQMKQIKAAGDYGMANYDASWYDILSLYAGVATSDDWGIDWANNKTKINPDKYAQMLQFLIAAKPYITEVNNDDQGAVDLFTSNKLAYYNGGPWNDPTFQAAKIDYDYAVIPGATSAHGGGISGFEFLGLAPNKNIDVAFQFATYICDYPQMIRWAQLLNRYNSNLKTLDEVKTPLMNITVEAAKSSLLQQPPDFTKAYPANYFQTILDNVTSVESGQMTPTAGAQDLITKLNAIIAADQ